MNKKSLSDLFSRIKSHGVFFKSRIDYQKVTLHERLKDSVYTVDEITASDLQIDSFIEKYDNCRTTCGSDLFHHWMHSVKNKEQIDGLQEDMKTIAENKKLSEIEKILSKVSKQRNGCLVRDLWNGFSVKNKIIDNFYLLFFFNLLTTTLLSIFLTKYIIFFIIFFFVFNFILFITTNRYISHVTASLGYFFSLCRALKKIDRKTKLKLNFKTPDYKKFNSLLSFSLFFKQGFGGPGSGDILSLIIDYFRIFFCLELFSFKIVEKSVLKNQKEIRDIYLYMGYLDCIINSIYIIEENKCCFSEITDENKIDFKELRHPLLEKSTGQTKCIDRNLIVTGLNMSGKTTFMRAAGLNQILATNFGFAFADYFKTSVYDVLSSININDSLLNGKSRYYAEAERLVKIKNLLKKHSCVCFIDEILSGTNSDERIEGSTKILKDFSKYDSIMIAATHDTQIAKNLSKSYEPVYFDGVIKKDKIIFDYKIKNGIVTKKNGLLILKLLG